MHCLKLNYSSSVLDDVSSWNTPRFWWNKRKHGSTHSAGLLGQNRHSYLDSQRFWFFLQCLHVLEAFFFFSVGGIVERWWKDACDFKWRFGGGRPNKFVTIASRKFFMFFAMGFFVFLVYIYIISVAEKDFHDVNPNFLVPSYCFLQCRYDSIWSDQSISEIWLL